MPKCSRCPIKTECNQNPIIVDRPTRTPKEKRNFGETIKLKVCPLLVAIGHAVQPPSESTLETKG